MLAFSQAVLLWQKHWPHIVRVVCVCACSIPVVCHGKLHKVCNNCASLNVPVQVPSVKPMRAVAQLAAR